MGDYDIGEAFRTIEEELLQSMMRNMRRHRLEEIDEKKQWEMWQAMQLRSLEQYRQQNAEKYSATFRDINDKIDEAIRQANEDGKMDQEIAILESIKNGFKGYHKQSDAMTGSFFRLNDRKLEALIKATTDDMQKAEAAVLRRVNDQYRKIIFDAQMYANTGAGTYEKAVDMATKDFLSAGIQCIEYKNGSKHKLSDYADMAIRTASKRAYLQGEGVKRQEWGMHLVILNKRGDNPCPLCIPFVGKVLIDDVWSGGSAKDGNYPLMSDAMAAGLYHPRCRDSHTTYFPGITTAPEKQKLTKKEVKQIGEQAKEEAREQYTERQAEKYGRLAEYSLDPENREQYREKEKTWSENSHKGIARDSVMDRKAISSPEYIKKIEKLPETQELRRTIREELISAIEHRNGTLFEDLIFIDSKSGSIKRSVDFHKARSARPTRKMRKMLKECDEKTIIAIHNHPGSSIPSWDDIEAASQRKYKYGLIACHNGRIFKYEIVDELNASNYYLAVARLERKGYTESSLREFCGTAIDAGVRVEVL